MDHLLSGSTFLDLAGQLGDAQGVWLATAVTWLDSAESRFSLWTMGEVDPPPRPRGAAGWLAAHLVRKLMRKLAPQAAPVPMRTAEDLALVIRKHTSELMATGAKPVLFEGDPLQARFAQQEHDER